MFFDGINTTQIFKNYHTALNDNSLNLKDCSSILNILEDDAKFNKFTSISRINDCYAGVRHCTCPEKLFSEGPRSPQGSYPPSDCSGIGNP